jgi:hypothetical protein
MLELAVVEIQHQDEQVWTMKQDEHNQPIFFWLSPSVPQFDPISLWDWVFESCAAGRHLYISIQFIQFNFNSYPYSYSFEILALRKT